MYTGCTCFNTRKYEEKIFWLVSHRKHLKSLASHPSVLREIITTRVVQWPDFIQIRKESRVSTCQSLKPVENGIFTADR